jgi:SAM-dependent methyltransferase
MEFRVSRDVVSGEAAGKALCGGYPMSLRSWCKRLMERSRTASIIREIEDWWFDTTRRVRTRGNRRKFGSEVVGEIHDSLTYIPLRAANARRALRDLPIADYSRYTFVDLGSGKGRLLFVAAEFAFRAVVGVEFEGDLHRQACENIRRRRFSRHARIESIHGNAADFEFPNENLVICMFNPFGPRLLGLVLKNLERSMQRHPRHVLILMIFPVLPHMVAEMKTMRLYKATRRHHIYQTDPEPKD